jgi:hypothetical protein
MENKKEFKLIDGVFATSDVNSLLSNLIEEKIRFHKLDDFSNHIRNDRDSQHSKERITELVETKSDLRAWINLVKQNASHLVVKSTVTIEIDENFQQS